MKRIISIVMLAQKLGLRHFFVRSIQHFYYKFKGSIYPIKLPEIVIEESLDILLLELPPRYIPMMPYGLSSVHNCLKSCAVKHQIIDINILIYHQYHQTRIMKNKGWIELDGYVLPRDPWDNVSIQEWDKPELQEYFFGYLKPLFDELEIHKPKSIGISVHGNNRSFALMFVVEVRQRFPDIVIIVGGYDCVYYETAPHLFPDFDYMVIGEAELTLPKLIESLAKGERPVDLPGIISRFDSTNIIWRSGAFPNNLDLFDFPRYEWIDVSLYRTFDGKHFVPIVTSRGCKWGRCTFCAECFAFRKRSPESVVDEIEFLVSKGFFLFHFNDSDVNGDSKNLYDICSEVIRRRLHITMMGQLRVDRNNTKEYFVHLNKAGFVHLRFGVDGWSAHTLLLQNKGYTMDMVHQNLKDCHDSNIRATVNMVVGVPGETEQDVDEMIDNIVAARHYIDLVEGINTLILAAGSEYYKNPEKYDIHFKYNKEEIYRTNPYFIPVDDWYSENPYIDHSVRIGRLTRICSCLLSQKVKVGSFALDVVNNLMKVESEK